MSLKIKLVAKVLSSKKSAACFLLMSASKAWIEDVFLSKKYVLLPYLSIMYEKTDLQRGNSASLSRSADCLQGSFAAVSPASVYGQQG